MVKQIRDGDVIQELIDRGDGYFHWLQKKSGLSGPLSSMLADTDFVSLYGLDDILVEKAKEETRRMYAEEVCEDDKKIDTVVKSVRGDCCMFEVILCLAISLNEMFEDLDACDGPSYFFAKLMENAGFDKYDEEDWDMREKDVRAYWEKCINRILKREYSDAGNGGLFPIKWIEDYNDDRKTYTDRRDISLWQQMNDWVDEHTNEDGEWVD